MYLYQFEINGVSGELLNASYKTIYNFAINNYSLLLSSIFFVHRLIEILQTYHLVFVSYVNEKSITVESTTFE